MDSFMLFLKKIGHIKHCIHSLTLLLLKIDVFIRPAWYNERSYTNHRKNKSKEEKKENQSCCYMQNKVRAMSWRRISRSS